MIRRLLVALAALLIPTAALARPAMWVVRDADSEIVLFGSVHVLPPGLDWRPPALLAALARADDVWFEIPFDPASQARFGSLAAERGLLPAGQSLSPMLSRAGRARMARIAQAYGVDPAALERMRPWMAELQLSLAVLVRDEGTSGDGVEEQIAAAAPPRARREAFETPEQQLAMFADAPQAVQLASLESTLKELKDDPTAYRRLLAAWMSGDPKALDKEAVASLKRETPVIYKRLVVDRNVRWVQVLSRRMEGSGRTVVVVGAGHLVGPDGLPTRLRKLGFKVEGP